MREWGKLTAFVYRPIGLRRDGADASEYEGGGFMDREKLKELISIDPKIRKDAATNRMFDDESSPENRDWCDDTMRLFQPL